MIHDLKLLKHPIFPGVSTEYPCWRFILTSDRADWNPLDVLRNNSLYKYFQTVVIVGPRKRGSVVSA